MEIEIKEEKKRHKKNSHRSVTIKKIHKKDYENKSRKMLFMYLLAISSCLSTQTTTAAATAIRNAEQMDEETIFENRMSFWWSSFRLSVILENHFYCSLYMWPFFLFQFTNMYTAQFICFYEYSFDHKSFNVNVTHIFVSKIMSHFAVWVGVVGVKLSFTSTYECTTHHTITNSM